MDATMLADALAPVLRELVEDAEARMTELVKVQGQEIIELRTELAALKAAAPKDGRDGVPGEKGDPGERGADGAPGVDGKEGPAGRDGVDGLAGKDGAAGLDGKDGVGLAGGMIDRDGALQVTLTDGKVIPLGVVVGKDGTPGKDGTNGRDVDPEDVQTIVEAIVEVEVQKQITAPLATAYKGVWTPGAYKCGDAVTWSGSLFIAGVDTEAKPESNGDWKLAVKRGRDGRDGELKAPAEPKSVKLK